MRGSPAPAPVHPSAPLGAPARFGGVAAAVLAYGVAMAFLESAVVIYLQRALGIDPRALFPLQDPAVTADLAVIEVGPTTITSVAGRLSNVTALALVKLVPVMSTGVRPSIEPEFGATLMTVGAGVDVTLNDRTAVAGA